MNFNDIEVKKSTFHKSKYLTDINEVNIDKVSYGKNDFKCSIGYNDDDKNLMGLNTCHFN